ERNIRLFQRGGSSRRGWRACRNLPTTPLRPACCGRWLRLSRLSVIASAQHLHLVGDDLGAVTVGAALLVLPFTGFEAPFHKHGTALLQVFACDLGQAPVKHDAVPFGF